MSEPLFDLPPVAPLNAPRLKLVGNGPVTYAAYAAVHPERCADCIQVLYEANRDNRLAPVARQARFTRTQDGRKIRLCAEHKHLRENDELEQAVIAEVKAQVAGF